MESGEILVDVNTTWSTDGLVGWWKFDETNGTIAYDSSGNGNDGNLTNGPTWATGKIGGALGFDGVNADVDFVGHLLHLKEPSCSVDPRQAVCISWIDVKNPLLDVLLIRQSYFSLGIHEILHFWVQDGKAFDIPKFVLQDANWYFACQ